MTGASTGEAIGTLTTSSSNALVGGLSEDRAGAIAALATLSLVGAQTLESAGAASLLANLLQAGGLNSEAAGAAASSAISALVGGQTVEVAGAESLLTAWLMPPGLSGEGPGASALNALSVLAAGLTSEIGGAGTFAANLALAAGRSEERAGASSVLLAILLTSGQNDDSAGSATTSGLLAPAGGDTAAAAGASLLTSLLTLSGGTSTEAAGALSIVQGIIILLLAAGVSSEGSGAPVLSSTNTIVGGASQESAGAASATGRLAPAAGISAEAAGASTGSGSASLSGAPTGESSGADSVAGALSLAAGQTAEAAGTSALVSILMLVAGLSQEQAGAAVAIAQSLVTVLQIASGQSDEHPGAAVLAAALALAAGLGEEKAGTLAAKITARAPVARIGTGPTSVSPGRHPTSVTPNRGRGPTSAKILTGKFFRNFIASAQDSSQVGMAIVARIVAPASGQLIEGAGAPTSTALFAPAGGFTAEAQGSLGSSSHMTQLTAGLSAEAPGGASASALLSAGGGKGSEESSGAPTIASILSIAGADPAELAGAVVRVLLLTLAAGQDAEAPGTSMTTGARIFVAGQSDEAAGAVVRSAVLAPAGGSAEEAAGAGATNALLAPTAGGTGEASGSPGLGATLAPASSRSVEAPGAPLAAAILALAGGNSSEYAGAVQAILNLLLMLLTGGGSSESPGAPAMLATNAPTSGRSSDSHGASTMAASLTMPPVPSAESDGSNTMHGALALAASLTGEKAGAITMHTTLAFSGGFSSEVYGSVTASSTGGGGTAPLILYMDSIDGSVNGGEGGNGHYLSVYGANFGAFADLGSSTGARVFIGGAEVGNYRVLDNAVTTANNGAFIVKRLICQVGSTATRALTLGSAYQVTVTVNGVTSNLNDQFGLPLMYTPTNAPTIFLSETGTGTGTDTNPGAGNDANAGTIAAPKLHMQTFLGGSSFGGVLTPNTTVTGGVSNGIQAGTQIVLRAGTYAQTTTHANRFAEYFRVTGCPASTTPTGGSKGVNAGYIKTTAYPGPILGNACEVPFISNSGAGGFMGADSARTGEATPYGFTGYCQYIAHSNLKITISSTQTDGSAAPIYCNNGSNYWMNVNNDCAFPNANHMLSAGISAGNGLNQRNYGNYIHDVFCDSGLQNHGIYMDGGVVYNAGSIVAYNYIKNITGGSGIQCFNQAVSGTDANGNNGFVNITVAYNWIDGTGKYGINMADSSISGKWYGNHIMNTVAYPLRWNTSETNMAITIQNNTFYNGNPTGVGASAMIVNDWNVTSGYIEIIDNIVVLGASRSAPSVDFYSNNGVDTNFVWKNNLYFDPQGHTTSAPTGGTRSGELYADPKWTTPYTDFSLQVTSPAIGAGVTNTHLTVATDFALKPNPRTGQTNPSIGAYA